MHDMLRRAAGRTSLHMPGGQGRAPFGRLNPYRLETTELDATDDLYRPTGAIARAQELAAKSAGAAHTMMLHGGGTAGVQAMLLYAARRGETVILPRNAHISAIHLCALTGIVPAFAKPDHTPTGRPFTAPESYLHAMEEHPEAKAVFVVRPDYYGGLPELRAIAAEAHARGMLVLCDEAHGAYFNWDRQAENAGACGADLFVQSAHKTLPALNAGAWLHAMPGVEPERLTRMLRMVQTSSPSFVGLLSLDDARAWMDSRGAKACDRLRMALAKFRARAARLGYVDAQNEDGMRYDPLRLALYAPQGGFCLGKELAARGIDVEMCDERRIVCIVSLMDGRKRLRKLYRAIKRIERKRLKDGLPPVETNPVKRARSSYPGISPRVLPLGEAAFAPQEAVALEEAAGRVSAGQVGLYPPGIALLTAGERVTQEMVDYLRGFEPSRLFGINQDGTLACVCEKETENGHFPL